MLNIFQTHPVGYIKNAIMFYMMQWLTSKANKPLLALLKKNMSLDMQINCCRREKLDFFLNSFLVPRITILATVHRPQPPDTTVYCSAVKSNAKNI